MSRSVVLLALAVLVAGACSGPSSPTPALSPLTISCPASVSALSANDSPVSVSFSAPAVGGGMTPVTSSCTPGSGSQFAVGNTTVTCTAQDASRQTAVCSFGISVTKVPRLAATRVVAFGDSITEGATSSCVRTFWGMTFAETMRVLPRATGDPWSYPTRLQAGLANAYPAQSVSVQNAGRSGEGVSAGAARLSSVLDRETPDVLLLQEGANDVNQGASPESIAGALRTMVRMARARSIHVFLGTLLPQRPLGVQGSCRGFRPDAISPANEQIRQVASTEVVPLVDLYEVFGAVPGALIGPDGLHPSEAGYQAIADTFLDAMRARLEY